MGMEYRVAIPTAAPTWVDGIPRRVNENGPGNPQGSVARSIGMKIVPQINLDKLPRWVVNWATQCAQHANTPTVTVDALLKLAWPAMLAGLAPSDAMKRAVAELRNKYGQTSFGF